MSGICGVVRLDGKPAEPGEIDGMVRHLERRGPDGTQVWAQDNVALGHARLATTPEAADETQPLTHKPTGCTITADARIDNRDDLISKLGLLGADRLIGDGELILLAYLKWGPDCPAHLIGDFAFAIWDPRDRSLFSARDLVGMRQLLYHHRPGSLFAFATEAQAMLRHADIPCVINEARIADFLEDLEAHDLTSTFFEGLFRLPPAHALRLRENDLQVWKHTELDPPIELKLSSDGEYAEALREVLTGAVQARLRSAKPVASMLSGGMDSGSVSALAASLLRSSSAPPLQTISAMGSDPDCVETQTIRSALSIDHIDPVLVHLSEMDSYRSELEAAVRSSGEPFDAHMTLVIAVYLAAQKAGANVLLDGVGGDTTLESGNMVAWHLRHRRFVKAWREARGEERFYKSGKSAITPYARGIGRMMAPDWLRQRRRATHAQRAEQEADRESLLDPEFARQIKIGQRRRDNAAHVARPGPGNNRDRRSRVLHPYVVVARERYDRAAGYFGIEPRDPFLDRRVLEFALSLPPEQLQKDGWPKMVLRRAMDGLLPDIVRWRTGKEHLGWDFTMSLWGHLMERPDLSFFKHMYPIEKWATARKTRSDAHAKYSMAESLNIEYLLLWMEETLIYK